MAETWQNNTTTQERRGRNRDSISSLARGAHGLNTIIEEAEADADRIAWPASPCSRSTNRQSWLRVREQQLSQKMQQQRRKGPNGRPTHLDIDGWLSPMSDHFPTPRGFHFLPAPILPATPSISSFDPATDDRDDADDVSCTGTDSTEFDDLCEVPDSEDDDHEAVPSHAATARAFLPQLVIPSRQASSTLATDGIESPSKDKDQWMGPEMSQVASAVQLSPETIEMMERHQAGSIPDISAPPSLDGSLDSDQLAGLSSPPTPILGPGVDGDNEETSVCGDRPMWSGVRLEPAALATLRRLAREQEDEEEVEEEDGMDMDVEDDAEQGIIEIALEQPQQQSSPRPPMMETRNATLRLFTQLNRNSMPATLSGPNSATSESIASMSRASRTPELTKLEIPSPNTFFANLTPGTRHTWGAGQPTSASTADEESLNTGMAERFYQTPWDEQARAQRLQPTERSSLYRRWFTSGPPVEHVVEVAISAPDEDQHCDEEDQPTARPINTAIRMEALASPGRQSDMADGLEAIEIILVADPVQARQQQSVALAQLDRMETWLAAQRAYLPSMACHADDGSDDDKVNQQKPRAEMAKPLLQPPPFILAEEAEAEEKPLPSLPKEATEVEVAKESLTVAVVPARKKSVRFSVASVASNIPRELPSTIFRKESAYYRAFVDYMIRQHPNDVFVHRQPRFEALQAQRASLHESHRRQLLGKYQLSVVPQSSKKRLSANVARGDDEVVVDDPEKLRRDKEAEAADQMAMSLWHVAAMKLLAGGRLVRAPVAKRLARVSRMAPGPDGVPRDRARILDLGGQATCDWAWHCAYAYPNTKIYTVATTAVRQLSNSNIRGPPNHRRVAVDKLSRLPFADATFDLVSARDLHAILKSSGASGEDEWDACLAECMRVLKPGGYLDFSLLDSDMINPGPLGLAKSVEFGFALKTLGYDPAPTKAWLGRLHRAGFQDVRRAWTCLPMGEKPVSKNRAPSMSMSPTTATAQDSSSSLVGGTAPVAAVAGIAAGWSWERWLLRCETEKVASERRLCAAETATSGEAVREAAGRCLMDVHAVVDEGRACGAAWRMLTGWARKPRSGMGTISIALAE